MATPIDSQSQFKLPMPPPPLALSTRTQYENMYDSNAPSTPNASSYYTDFVTPQQTPQGSPSKSHMPPGAYDLPAAFDSSMRLAPAAITTSSSSSSAQSGPGALASRPQLPPTKSDFAQGPSSPTRKSNKENTPPGMSLRSSPKKEMPAFLTQAAQSRAQPYRTNREVDSAPPQYVSRGLTPEDLEKLKKPSVKRLANVTQLYFLDHYYDLLSYTHARHTRLSQFKAAYPYPPETDEETYNEALTKYLGRERANLRKRRTRLRHGDFQILTQVGQGGYGQVYLAQKKDTKEVCALKVMSKTLLFKLDEVRHVLTERDILTTANSEWLVRLLYSFQDEKSIYLAMVSLA
jgi:cell cycle protein kinase DBF2